MLPRPRRRRLPAPGVGSRCPLAAAAAAAAILLVGRPGRAARRLSSTTGESVDVTAAVQVTPVGREVELDIERLRDPRPDGLYELWFVSADAQGADVSAGTFHPDEQGRGTVRLLAAADPWPIRGCPSRSSPTTATRAAPAPKCCARLQPSTGSGAVAVGALESSVLGHLERRAGLPDHLRDDLRDRPGRR